MVASVGTIKPAIISQNANLFPGKCNRDNANAAMEVIASVPAVVTTAITALFHVHRHKAAVLVTYRKFSNVKGGLNNALSTVTGLPCGFNEEKAIQISGISHNTIIP